jgi:hypothetical protein
MNQIVIVTDDGYDVAIAIWQDRQEKENRTTKMDDV